MELEGFECVSPILRSGVYALCAKGRVIYVGKSKSMIGRINIHRRAHIDKRKRKEESWIVQTLGIPALWFDEIHIRPTPLHLLDAVEREMIDRYKPHYNEQLKTNAKIKAPLSIVIGALTLRMNAPHEPLVTRR